MVGTGSPQGMLILKYRGYFDLSLPRQGEVYRRLESLFGKGVLSEVPYSENRINAAPFFGLITSAMFRHDPTGLYIRYGAGLHGEILPYSLLERIDIASPKTRDEGKGFSRRFNQCIRSLIPSFKDILATQKAEQMAY